MLLFHPFTVRDPQVWDALQQAAVGEAIWDTDVSGGDDLYWKALAAVWHTDDDLLIVEHDVIVTGAILDGFDNCPEPWCCQAVNRHSSPNMLLHHLGCTRFRQQLLTAEPDALEQAGRFSAGMPPKHFKHLDVAMYETLTRRGYRPHAHYPPAVHLNLSSRL